MIPVASPARSFASIPTEEIIALLKMLERPAYQISRLHSNYYVELKSVLRDRKVNP